MSRAARGDCGALVAAKGPWPPTPPENIETVWDCSVTCVCVRGRGGSRSLLTNGSGPPLASDDSTISVTADRKQLRAKCRIDVKILEHVAKSDVTAHANFNVDPKQTKKVLTENLEGACHDFGPKMGPEGAPEAQMGQNHQKMAKNWHFSGVTGGGQIDP